MSCSGSSTSSELAEDDKTAAGISPGLVRISAGITGTLRQRLAQLDAALDELATRENRGLRTTA
jgi:methionine-gamma-lyase